MAGFFFDSSAIIKRYLNETGSAWVRTVTAPSAGNRLHLARITGVEVVAAITRRSRGETLSTSAGTTALGQFRTEFGADYDITEIPSGLQTQAMNLAETHGLRGYDAVQLAAALEVRTQYLAAGLVLTLVSADAELNAAAASEGMTVEDPNNHP